MVNIPNFITLARMLTVPLLVWLILNDRLVPAFWIFIAAGVSDAVDGFVAKRFNSETNLGKFLDPLADKAVLVSVFVSLGYADLLETWLIILVVFRDVLIIGGAILYETLTHSLTMEPLMISKVNTVAQIVLAASALGVNAFEINDGGFIGLLVIAVAATTLLSGAAYVFTWGRRAAAMEAKR